MDFNSLFQPKTIAVIGVSLSDDRHPANVIYNKMHLRYPVRVFPVNPRGGKLRKAPVYADIGDVPERIDLAVVAVRAEYVPDIISKCIKIGVGAALIVSGGFAESGRKDLQDRLVAIARAADFPFIGPNCLGIYSPGIMDTFFLPGERLVRPEPGNVAIVSQSGGVLVDQMVKFAGQGIGLSLAVSIGNKALIGEMAMLGYLDRHPDTRVIAFYIEGFASEEGLAFVRTASRMGKPVVVLKAGKSRQGTRAVVSHTAALAGNYRVFSAALAQHGIAEARNEFELVSFCEALSCYRTPIDGRIGIVTVSGGHGALASDTCAERRLHVPRLPEPLQQEIRRHLAASIRDIAALQNPVDLTGSARDDDFVAAAEALSRAPDVDCILILLLPYSPGITSDLGARLSHVYQKRGKPLIAYVPHVERYRMLIEGFELNRVPVSSSIEGAVLMAEALKRCRPCRSDQPLTDPMPSPAETRE